jgi:signal transduction histidine kinase
MQKGEIDIIYFVVITTLIILLLIISVVLLVISYRRRQDSYFSHLDTLHSEHEKELLKLHLETQEKTFEYVSKEIHDNIGQYISLAAWQLNGLKYGDNGINKDQLDPVTLLLNRTLNDLRSLSKSMSPDYVTRRGIIEAMEEQAELIRKSTGLPLTMEQSGERCYLNEERELIVFRIFQESVSNTVRHADANHISISLYFGPDSLVMKIVDDGKGFNYEELNTSNITSRGSGLSNMTRRAALAGGNLQIRSQPGEGTTIELAIPYS